MSLYVYCVTDEPDSDTPLPPGLQERMPRIVSEGLLNAAVSDFDGKDLTPAKENIFAHERVIEAFMDRSTPLPFRFGTVVAEATLREFLDKSAPVLLADLEKVRGCVEMGVKVMFAAPAETGAYRSGTEFLKAKRRLQDFQRETAGWVEAGMEGLIRLTEVSFVPISTKNIVTIAHLVLRDHLNEYKSHIEALVLERTDCAFLRSGPWPPYSFITTPRLG